MFTNPNLSAANGHLSAAAFGRRSVLGFLLVAAAPLSRRAVADTAPQDATATIGRLNEALLGAMKAGDQTDFSHRFTSLAPAIEQAFDLPAVLSVSVGPAWSGLSQAQQNRLLDAFRRYTVASYVANFDSYTGQRFSVSPDTRDLGDGRVVVKSRITPVTGDATEARLCDERDRGGLEGGRCVGGGIDKPGRGAAIRLPARPVKWRRRCPAGKPAAQDLRPFGLIRSADVGAPEAHVPGAGDNEYLYAIAGGPARTASVRPMKYGHLGFQAIIHADPPFRAKLRHQVPHDSGMNSGFPDRANDAVVDTKNRRCRKCRARGYRFAARRPSRRPSAEPAGRRYVLFRAAVPSQIPYSAAFTYIGSGYSALPASATRPM